MPRKVSTVVNGEPRPKFKERVQAAGLWRQFCSDRTKKYWEFKKAGIEEQAARNKAWYEVSKNYTPEILADSKAVPKPPPELSEDEEAALDARHQTEVAMETTGVALDWGAYEWVADAMGLEAAGKEIKMEDAPSIAAWGFFNSAKMMSHKFYEMYEKKANQIAASTKDHNDIRLEAQRDAKEIEGMLRRIKATSLPYRPKGAKKQSLVPA